MRAGMEPRKTPPEYFLEIFADTANVRDVLKGELSYAIYRSLCSLPMPPSFRFVIPSVSLTCPTYPGVLHLIFFHRYFPSVRSLELDVLDMTLSSIDDADLDTLIQSRVGALVQQLSSAAEPSGKRSDGKNGGGGGVRGRIAVEFYEKKRSRSKHWFGGLAGAGEEEVCWEIWTLDVTIATPKTESGEYS